MNSTHSLRLHALALALAPASTFAANIYLSSSCSLRDAIVAANTDAASSGCTAGSAGADSIVFEAGSMIELTQIDPLGDADSGTPLVNSDVTLQGNGSTLTRANGAPDMRFLEVTGEGRLTIDSLTVTGGEGKIGVIYAYYANSLIITNSTISDNDGGSDAGGGITSLGTDTYIKDSVVTRNTSGLSAGLRVEAANLRLVNTTVSENEATIAKSGVYLAYGNLTMINSRIVENTTAQNAGLNVYAAPSSIEIIGSQIDDNVATQRKSGAYVYGASTIAATVSNSSIDGNEDLGGHAGARFATYSQNDQNSVFTIIGSSISNNTSVGGNAGLVLAGSDSLDLSDSDVSANRGDLSAGVRLLGDPLNYYYPTAQLNNVTVTGNSNSVNDVSNTASGANRSGIVASYAPSVELNDVRLNNNRATLSSGLYAFNSSVSVTGGYIKDSYSKNTLEATINAVSSELSLSEMSVSGNSSDMGSGALRFVGASQRNLTVLRSTFSGNRSNNAPIVSLESGLQESVELNNSTFSSNTGQLMNIQTLGPVSITNNTFAFNTGYGAITVTQQPSVFSIDNTVFGDHNSAICSANLSFTGSNNWFSDDSCTGTAQGSAGLEVLSDNGGPTLTHAIGPLSPLIGAGNTTICDAAPILGLDQRGQPRDRFCDIGAYEFIEAPVFFVIPAKNGRTVIIEL